MWLTNKKTKKPFIPKNSGVKGIKASAFSGGKTEHRFLKRNERIFTDEQHGSSQYFLPTEKQINTAKSSWDSLRPIQRRSLLEMDLDDKSANNQNIHDTLDYISFRKFSELSPNLQKSITYMIGGN